LTTSHAKVAEALQHHLAGRVAEAEAIYREVLAIAPDHADSLHLLGMIAYQNGDLDAAAQSIRQAIAQHENAASYHCNLGNVLQAQDKLDEAAASFERAIALGPDLAEIPVNLGNIRRAQGRLDDALTCYRRSLAVRPGFAEAAMGEALVLLLQGNFAAGWPGFERRWETLDHDTPMRAYEQPLWTGEPLAGTLRIWPEQGIGDEILFAGLIPDLLHSGHQVVLECDPRLQPLFARSFPGVQVVSGDEARHANFAAHLPIGSLPGLLRRRAEDFVATNSPYLMANPALRDAFRARYADGRRLIGLAWSTTNPKTGRHRSLTLQQLAPLFQAPGIRWVSLQYGDHDALEQQAAAAKAPLLIDRSVDQLADMDTFAAQLAALDLVVTIDNSTANLAGALGVRTFVLLPFAPEWRWLESGDTTPWYPTLRLFRQPASGDWTPVVQSVRQLLEF
jgi:cytochrome c-type biogenesis protein CcmH/NrfG